MPVKTDFIKTVSETDDAFIEMVNHELKSPLTSIKIFIETLEKRLETTNKKDFKNNLKNVDQKIDYLTSLINEYTDIVRIRSGNLIFFDEKLSLEIVLNKCFQKIKDNYNYVEIENTPFLNKKIKVDKDRLYQVFKNLIIFISKISGEIEKIKIESKSNQKYVVFNLRSIDYQYPKDVVNYFDPEILTKEQMKVLPLRENLRIGSCLAAEIVKFYHGKFMICSDLNSKIVCCFSLPLSK